MKKYFYFIFIFRLDEFLVFSEVFSSDLIGLEILVWIQKYWSLDTTVLVPGYKSTGPRIQKYWSLDTKVLVPDTAGTDAGRVENIFEKNEI